MSNISSDYAYIYTFVSKNINIPLFQRLFYDGSSNQLEVRLGDHITCIFQKNEEDKYTFINNTVGIDGFDVYILDHVPRNLQFTYERIYHDVLNDNFDLKNTTKPKPESVEIAKDKSILDEAFVKVNDLKKRISESIMTPEEKIINELKKNLIQKNKIKYGDPQKPEIDRLKTQNKELRVKVNNLNEQFKQLNDLNATLQEEIKSLKETNIVLKENVELHKTVGKLKDSIVQPQQQTQPPQQPQQPQQQQQQTQQPVRRYNKHRRKLKPEQSVLNFFNNEIIKTDDESNTITLAETWKLFDVVKLTEYNPTHKIKKNQFKYSLLTVMPNIIERLTRVAGRDTPIQNYWEGYKLKNQ